MYIIIFFDRISSMVITNARGHPLLRQTNIQSLRDDGSSYMECRRSNLPIKGRYNITLLQPVFGYTVIVIAVFSTSRLFFVYYNVISNLSRKTIDLSRSGTYHEMFAANKLT